MKWLVVAMVISCQAQTPAFEVASVKLNRSSSGMGSFRPEPGRMTVTNMTLKSIVQFAYGVRDYQVSGGPSWLNADRWDIAATAGGTISDQDRKRMLQTLLEDRFQLSILRETKELPVYSLVVSKGGSKMRVNREGKEPQLSARMNAPGSTQLTGVAVPMSKLADVLVSLLGRSVIDRTGIDGNFDFELEFAPAHITTALNGAKVEPSPDGASIFTALQEQLGLKLESTKGPVEMLVIERAQKATEN